MSMASKIDSHLSSKNRSVRQNKIRPTTILLARMPHPFSTRTFIRCGILTSWRRRRLHKRMPLLRQPINRSTVEKATLRTRRHRPSPAWAFLLVIRQAWPTDNSNRISSIPSISLCLHPVHVHNRHSIVRINRPSKINLRKSKAGDVACSTIFLLLWFSLNTFLDSKRSRKPHIKKPLNAFMIYMKEQRARVIEECTLKESSAINKVLGQKWKELSRTEQDRYYGRRPSFVRLSHTIVVVHRTGQRGAQSSHAAVPGLVSTRQLRHQEETADDASRESRAKEIRSRTSSSQSTEAREQECRARRQW